MRRTAVASVLVVFLFLISSFCTIVPAVDNTGASSSVTYSEINNQNSVASNDVSNSTSNDETFDEKFKKIFKTSDDKASSIDDIVGTDDYTLSPLEFTYINSNTYKTYEISGSDTAGGFHVSDVSNISVTNDVASYHSTSFGAALTKNINDVDTTVAQKQDWICVLFYDDVNKNDSDHCDLMLSVKSSADNSGLAIVQSLDDLIGSTPFEYRFLKYINSLQSANILNYCVGDFDGDGNEEIAVHHWFSAYIFGLKDGKITLENRYDLVSKYPTSNYQNSLFTAVSMVSGDIDLDGADELLMTRNYYRIVSDSRGGTYTLEDEHSMLHIMDCCDTGDEYDIDDGLHSYEIKVEYKGSTFDAVMASVSLADIDGDYVDEIIIGGYTWDNDQWAANKDVDYVNRSDNYDGELFLAYSKCFNYTLKDGEYKDLSCSIETYDTDTIKLNGVTILRDDDLTATTRYYGMKQFVDDGEYSGNWKDNYSGWGDSWKGLEDHHSADTSIYLGDTSSSYACYLCRAVNWCNWTIPMAGCAISDSGDDKLFFDLWFYSYDADDERFEVYKKTDPFADGPDNNNVICQNISVGVITSQNSTQTTEQLIINFGMDLAKLHDGDTEWGFVVYSDDEDNEKYVRYQYSSQFDHISDSSYPLDNFVITDWGLYRMPMIAIGNFDSDTKYLAFYEHTLTYTNPTVKAFISATPYSTSLNTMLKNNGLNITDLLSTNIELTETYGSGLAINTHVGAGYGNSIVSIKGTFDLSYRRVTTTYTSTSVNTADQDIVILNVIPVDIYKYRVIGGSENEIEIVEMAQNVSHDAVLSYSEYYDFMCLYWEKERSSIEKYNESLGEYGNVFSNGTWYHYDKFPTDVDSFVISNAPAHTIGTPSSYKSRDSGKGDLKGSETFFYSFSGTRALKEISKEISVERETTGTFGVEITSPFFDFSINAGTVGVDGSSIKFGLSCDSRSLNDELLSIAENYQVSGTIWCEERTIMPLNTNCPTIYTEIMGNNCHVSYKPSTYYYIGYTVDSSYEATDPASIYSPDVFDSVDEEFLPTSNSICLKVSVPGMTQIKNTNAGIKCEDVYYAVQCKSNNDWHNIDGKNIGLIIQYWDGNKWVVPDELNHLKPSNDQREQWIKLSNLKNNLNYRVLTLFDSKSNDPDDDYMISMSNTIYAPLDLNNYDCTVRFIANGEVFHSYVAKANTEVILPEETPTKKSEGAYSYKFDTWAGWYKGMTVTKDLELTALFVTQINDLSSFLNGNSYVLNSKSNGGYSLTNNALSQVSKSMDSGNKGLKMTDNLGSISFDKTSLTSFKWDGVEMGISDVSNSVKLSSDDYDKYTVYDVSLSNNSGDIHKFNNGKITVSLLYSGSTDDIKVGYLNDNNKVSENMDFTKTSTSDGKTLISFDSSHLSKFVIYEEAESSNDSSGDQGFCSFSVIGALSALIAGLAVAAIIVIKF